MKSIMQEASSVVKAIQKAWLDAGKPKEFSVKVFEEPIKNFLGMTTQSAKIGLFFEEKTGKRREKQRPRIEARPQKTFETKQPIQEKKVTHQQELAIKEQKQKEEQPAKVMWTDDMIQKAREWLSQVMQTMSKSNVSFTTQANNYYLRFTFDGPMAETPEKERQLFRSFSFLMLQALKQQLKRPLRGFKVVLTRES
jgi:predicted RNA-binding protein Jag